MISYTHVFIYMQHVHIDVHICLRLYMCILFAHMCIFYVHTYLHAYVFIHVHMCIYAHTHHTYMHTHVYMRIHCSCLCTCDSEANTVQRSAPTGGVPTIAAGCVGLLCAAPPVPRPGVRVLRCVLHQPDVFLSVPPKRSR